MRKIKFWIMSIGVLLLLFTTCSCGIRYQIKGRVIDAETGEPVEGAAVSLRWNNYQVFPRLTGMGSGFEHVATYDTLTDADGYFLTNKLLLTDEYKMAVYKKGYVCWSSRYIFNSDPNLKKDSMREVECDVTDGMEIKLHPFKNHYSKYEHARFMVFNICSFYDGKIFQEATSSEEEIFYRGKKE